LKMSNPGIRQIQSVEDLIKAVREDSLPWHPKEPKWFRGEPHVQTALTPTLYRHGLTSHENALLQMFRAKATGFHDVVPMREHTDQWLFLARHAGLPTRLLDWSEGALIALYFALKETKPVVWMLSPLDLNDLSNSAPSQVRPREFPLPWHDPDPNTKSVLSPAFENLRGAWEQGGFGVPLPVAIYPTYVHPRMRGQRSCFTIHGTDTRGLDSLLAGRSILKGYVVDPDPACRQSIRSELAVLGITDSVAFPDIDGLANELKERYS
jgi:FRG domain